MLLVTYGNPIPALKSSPMDNNFLFKVVRPVMGRMEPVMAFSQMILPGSASPPCKRWQVQKIVGCKPLLTSQILFECWAPVLPCYKAKSYVAGWVQVCPCGARSLRRNRFGI